MAESVGEAYPPDLLTLRINEVVSRAIQDEPYAVDPRERALAAARGGMGSEPMRALLSQFARSPEELARMTPQFDVEGVSMKAQPWTTIATTTTLTTTTTTSTPACTTTTTTTTLTTTTTFTNFCPHASEA
jgi:hypothetical protein